MNLGNSDRRKRAGGTSVIGAGLVIKGELETEGSVRVDGRIEGRQHRVGTLEIGNSGVVVGDVVAETIVVEGTIQGTVHVTGRIEMGAKSVVSGEVRARSVKMVEGARLEGQVVIGQEALEEKRAESGVMSGKREQMALAT